MFTVKRKKTRCEVTFLIRNEIQKLFRDDLQCKSSASFPSAIFQLAAKGLILNLIPQRLSHLHFVINPDKEAVFSRRDDGK